MGETQRPESEKNFLKDFLIRIWRNIILVIILLILSVSGGIAYSFLKKPTYTAKLVINYQAELELEADSVGNISVMKDMLQSVVDLSVTEIVLDEADYLYDKFLRSPNMTVEEFISDVNDGNGPDVTEFVDSNPHRIDTKYYSPDKVSAKSLGETTSKTGPKYMFTISVSDENEQVAIEKAKILALSGNRVSREFFDGYTTVLDELESSVSSDISVVKNVLISFVIGLVLSIVVVYLKCLLDKTATDKDEIERLTGTTVIAFIDDQEEK